MVTAILDTNVFIRAALRPRSPSARVEADADYLVTKDGRHLLRLKNYRRTRIVTPTQFLAVLTRP